MNKAEANYRIVRYDGRYRVEVLDKVIGWWYIAVQKPTFDEAVAYCKKEFEQ